MRDEVLSKLKPSDLNEYNRSTCLPNTRLDLIKFMIEWTAEPLNDQRSVLWLYGLAGVGKSTLMNTIVEMMRKRRRLGAFFFFDRDVPERNAATLIRTLAYQLGRFDDRIGTKLSQAIKCNPNIAQMSLDSQFANLLSALCSIEWSKDPIVLVIDALDECGTEHDRTFLMQALSRGFHTLPPFIRVLVTSRQVRDIEVAFASHAAVFPCYLGIDSCNTKEDIMEYLRHTLADIRRENKYLFFGLDWPGEDRIRVLGERARGLFVWASTACLYINSHDPRLRLEELTTQNPVDASSPFTQLDELYRIGLKSAGNWADPHFRSDCRNIFGVILSARIPLPCAVIDSLLGLPRPCLHAISRLGCVLCWDEINTIRVIHPSFYDYLTSRCHDEAWFIDVEEHQKRLAVLCINLLDKNLHENICGLTLPNPVQGKTLSGAISYACRFWVDHVCLVSGHANNIGDLIHDFLIRHLLHWIEAMAILRSHSSTIKSLERLLNLFNVWCLFKPPRSKLIAHFKERLATHRDLRQLIYDGYRFTQYFANTINKHPLLIYTTALPFTPNNTRLYHIFHRSSLPKVICGVPATWSPQLQMLRHGHGIASIAFSPDGTKIVSGSEDTTIRIWEASSGMEILPPLQGHDRRVTSVAFSQDGMTIVSGSVDKTVRVWDARTGMEKLPPLRGHSRCINSVAVSRDGTKIVSGSSDKTIRVWDAQNGIEILPPLRGHSRRVNSVAFSPDGMKIISGSSDKTIRVRNARTGIEIHPPLRGHNHDVTVVAFSPDGTTIISGSWDMTIRVWDARTGMRKLPPLRGHNNCVSSVAFSPDGTKITSGSWDKTIRVWNVGTGIEMPLRGHDNHVNSVAFSPDGTKIISGSSDKTIRVWDARISIGTVLPRRGHGKRVNSVTFSPDGTKIVSGSSDKTIRICDARSGIDILPPLRGHDRRVNTVAFSFDGTKIVSGSSDKTIRVWDARTGLETLPPLRGHTNCVNSVAFSPDGTKIISWSLDQTIRIWDGGTGESILAPLRSHNSRVNSVAFSSDGMNIVSGSWDKTIRVWDVRTGVETPLQGQDDYVNSVAFSLDGTKIISRSSDNNIHVWDARTGVRTFPHLRPHPANGNGDDNAIISRYRNVGSFLSLLPLELSLDPLTIQGSCCVGWTVDHELVIIHLPAAR